MEEKRLKQFTFYDLYYESLKGLPDEAAGRMAKNICRFMFTNDEIPSRRTIGKTSFGVISWTFSKRLNE